jgi:hypothetical protein
MIRKIFLGTSLMISCCAFSLSPNDLLSKAIPFYLSQSPSSQLLAVNEYGPAIALAAVFDCARLFEQPLWAQNATTIIDGFLSNPSSPAYALAMGQYVNPGYSIGDALGLLPLSYAARAQYNNISYTTNDINWKLSTIVVDQYVLPWNKTLPDGTISRDVGSWAPNQPDVNASFLWSDDQFMGSAMAVRLGMSLGFPTNKAVIYAEFVAKQQIGFASRMMDSSTGIFYHGYNAATNDNSCCHWGRANGWIMMAHAEVVKLLVATAPNSPLLQQVVYVWQKHTAGLLAVQNKSDGRWHEVLDHPETYLETSATAMFLQSMVDGVLGGFLDRASVTPAINLAWEGLSQTIEASGEVTGICEGTGIGANVEFYQARSTAYSSSAPGIGSVFRAAFAYEVFSKSSL